MKSNRINPKVGDLVVFNELLDATVFTVIERDGFHIRVVQAGTNYAPQTSDASLCLKPSKQQLANAQGVAA